MVDAWDPEQYERFAGPRAAPFHDLVGLVEPPGPRARVADLGCGTGQLTASLVARWSPSEVVGIDRSEAMLREASGHAGERLRFEAGDIGALGAHVTDLDVIVANAALQWVPRHDRVLADWVARLRPGGQLAVQVPANGDHPAHVVAAEVAAELRDEFGDDGPPPDPVQANVRTPAAYATLLDELGAESQHVRLQIYGMHLDGVDALVEWVRGTTLTRFRERLGADVYEAFVARYRERLGAVLGHPDRYFYPFARILLWGRWPAA